MKIKITTMRFMRKNKAPKCNSLTERYYVSTVLINSVDECSHCGRSIWRDDSRNGEYCQDCYDNLYETCTECGDDVCRDDVCYHNDEPYCQKLL